MPKSKFKSTYFSQKQGVHGIHSLDLSLIRWLHSRRQSSRISSMIAWKRSCFNLLPCQHELLMEVYQISLRPLCSWTANDAPKVFSSSTNILKRRSCFPSLSFLTYTPLPKLPWENQVYFVFIFISCSSKLSLAALLGLHSHRQQHLSSWAACAPCLLGDLITSLQPTMTLNKAKKV